MEELKERLYRIVKAEYKKLDLLCKKIQDSNGEKIELSHEDIIPLLNVLDTFDGVDLEI